MSIFFQHLRDPEYMHVLLNPMPVYGLAIAVLGLALALIFRHRQALIISLALVFVSGLSAWPTYSYGESAYDRIKSVSDPAGEQWLDEHMARAEKLIPAFYILAALAAAGMVLPLKWPRSSVPLAVATLALGATTLGIGGWISYPGGHVRHKEFRFESPPPAEAHHHGGEEQPEMHEHAAEQSPPAASPQPQMEHAQHEQMQAGPEQPKTEEEKKQLEASRLQLEASRLQLEASRKQLEATKGESASPSPSASPHPENDHKR
jgi:hypothetical protein